MLDASALKNIRPFVATPNYGGVLSSVYVRSLLALVNTAWSQGFAMHTRFLDGDSLITRARNRLVAEFMADTRWTHLMWIDADIGFEPEAMLRLMLSGHDVVAGVYPRKLEGPASFPVNLLQDGSSRVDADGFIEVLDAPSGFMLVARSVFERLAEAMPDLRYTPDVAGNEATRDWPHYRFFDVMAEPGNGRYLTEDYAFCRRWQSIGGKVFVDARSRLAHQGLKTYIAPFSDPTGRSGIP